MLLGQSWRRLIGGVSCGKALLLFYWPMSIRGLCRGHRGESHWKGSGP